MPTAEFEKELRRKFHDYNSLKRKMKQVQNSIRELQAEKVLSQGQEQPKLKVEELVYLAEVTLNDKLSATKSLAVCADQYHKPHYWAKKVIRYRPLREQVKRLLVDLENKNNYHFLLLKKYKLLNVRELLTCSEIRGLLNKLKRWSQYALALEQKNTEVARLNDVIEQLASKLKEKDLLLTRINQAKPKERAILLRAEYPDMTITELSKIVGVSRNSIYGYLKGN